MVFEFFCAVIWLPQAIFNLSLWLAVTLSWSLPWRSCGQNRNIFRTILLDDFITAVFSQIGYIQQMAKKGRFRALRYTADFALFTLYTTKSLSGKCNKSLTPLSLK